MDVKEIFINKAAASLEEISKWVEAGKDFVVEQAPLVVQEIIIWGIAQYVFFICISIIIMLICAYFCCQCFYSKWGKESWNNPDQNGPIAIIGGIISVVGMIINFIIMCNNIYMLLFIIYAPRLYLLKTMSQLLKGIN